MLTTFSGIDGKKRTTWDTFQLLWSSKKRGKTHEKHVPMLESGHQSCCRKLQEPGSNFSRSRRGSLLMGGRKLDLLAFLKRRLETVEMAEVVVCGCRNSCDEQWPPPSPFSALSLWISLCVLLLSPHETLLPSLAPSSAVANPQLSLLL